MASIFRQGSGGAPHWERWLLQAPFVGYRRKALRRALGVGAAFVFAVTGLGAVAPAASAEFAGRNGRIAFMRADDAGFWQVWVANADMTGQQQLTNGSNSSGWPVWAPHGREVIAFESERNDPDLTDDIVIHDIFVVRSDGTGVMQLTDATGYAADPAWSPNGRRIAFDDDFGDPSAQGIFTMRRNGSDLRRVTSLTPNGEFDAAPRYSPNGKRLVFTRVTLDGDTEHATVYVVNVDGSHLHRISPFRIGAGDADWSPDGRRVVFEADTPTGYRTDIFTVRPSGSHLRNLTHYDGASNGGSDPVWSPDGRTILFLKGVYDQDVFVKAGLATMLADGSHQRFVSATPLNEHQPDWQSLPCPHRRP